MTLMELTPPPSPTDGDVPVELARRRRRTFPELRGERIPSAAPSRRRRSKVETVYRVSFLQTCPTDLLLYLFHFLDARSLLRASESCTCWNAIISHFSHSLWRHLSVSRWSINQKQPSFPTWRDVYRLHHNVHHGNHIRSTFTTKAARPNTTFTSSSSGVPAVVSSSLPASSRPLLSWPTNPLEAYTIAHDTSTSLFCFVSTASGTSIYTSPLAVKPASPSFSYNTSASTSTLLGTHTHPIGLVLANHLGTLVSFDDTSLIAVWDLPTRKRLRTINAGGECGYIFSMNIWKNKIVTGGQEGKVIVWDARSGEKYLSIDIPTRYKDTLSVYNLLNVAIHDKYVAYGLYDGVFYVYDMEVGKVVKAVEVGGGVRFGVGYAPMTLAVRDWYLVTNGMKPGEIYLWDLLAEVSGGKNKGYLSISEARSQQQHEQPQGNQQQDQNQPSPQQQVVDTPAMPTNIAALQESETKIPVLSKPHLILKTDEGEIKFAEISPCGRVVYGGLFGGRLENGEGIVVWDFGGCGDRGDRGVKAAKLECCEGRGVWVGY